MSIILSRFPGFENRYGCAFWAGGSGALSLAVGTDPDELTLKLLSMVNSWVLLASNFFRYKPQFSKAPRLGESD